MSALKSKSSSSDEDDDWVEAIDSAARQRPAKRKRAPAADREADCERLRRQNADLRRSAYTEKMRHLDESKRMRRELAAANAEIARLRERLRERLCDKSDSSE